MWPSGRTFLSGGIEVPIKRRLNRDQMYCKSWLLGQTMCTVQKTENCSLCLCEIPCNEEVFLVACANNTMKHFFHKNCLIEYFIQSGGICIKCPNCRHVWYDMNDEDSD